MELKKYFRLNKIDYSEKINLPVNKPTLTTVRQATGQAGNYSIFLFLIQFELHIQFYYVKIT